MDLIKTQPLSTLLNTSSTPPAFLRSTFFKDGGKTDCVGKRHNLILVCVCVSTPFWCKTAQTRQLFYFILSLLSAKGRQSFSRASLNHTQNFCWHVIWAQYNLLQIIDPINTPERHIGPSEYYRSFHGRHKTASNSKQNLLKSGYQHH